MTKGESNRKNAIRSTGPKTPEGKAIVSGNALKHGAYSQAVIVKGEDPAAIATLRAGMLESLRPVGLLEEVLVDRLSALFWRLQRAGRAEREGLMLNNSSSSDPDRMASAFHAIATPGIGECMERLQRYEGQLERSFFRVLHELERIQARRKGEAVIPPVVADVSIHGVGSGG